MKATELMRGIIPSPGNEPLELAPDSQALAASLCHLDPEWRKALKTEMCPPQRVGSQREFDLAMNRLRTAQTDIMLPMKERMESLNSRRREIGRQMAELNIELGRVNRERDTLREECRNVGSIFYGLKKEMIRLNPKQVPPTAREEGAA